MSRIICEKTHIERLAAAIRNASGLTEKMNLGTMVTTVNSLGINAAQMCRVTFPEGNIGETLYYTDENFEAKSIMRTDNSVLSIAVPRNTIIYSNLNVFDGSVYVARAAGSVTVVNRGQAIFVKSAVTFDYADNAPA